MDIISRQEAKSNGLQFYFTSKACKHGHINKRYVSSCGCVGCNNHYNEKYKQYRNQHYQDNKEKKKQYAHEYRENNKETVSEYLKQYRETHKEERKQYDEKNQKRIKAQKKEWNSCNKERLKQYKLNYKEKYPEKVAVRKHEYLSRKTEATPQWYESEQINQLYRKRNELSKLWGITLHVDHIVPLQGKNVCGLHCWDNLQLLEANINHTKNNHFNS